MRTFYSSLLLNTFWLIFEMLFTPLSMLYTLKPVSYCETVGVTNSESVASCFGLYTSQKDSGSIHESTFNQALYVQELHTTICESHLQRFYLSALNIIL